VKFVSSRAFPFATVELVAGKIGKTVTLEKRVAAPALPASRSLR
jgi:hypothetical protein